MIFTIASILTAVFGVSLYKKIQNFDSLAIIEFLKIKEQKSIIILLVFLAFLMLVRSQVKFKKRLNTIYYIWIFGLFYVGVRIHETKKYEKQGKLEEVVKINKIKRNTKSLYKFVDVVPLVVEGGASGLFNKGYNYIFNASSILDSDKIEAIKNGNYRLVVVKNEVARSLTLSNMVKKLVNSGSELTDKKGNKTTIFKIRKENE